MFNRAVLLPQLLETFAALLDSLRQAGLDDTTAGQAMRSLCACAMGYGISELYCFGAWRADAGQQDVNTTDILLWLGRILPPRTPPRLVEAAPGESPSGPVPVVAVIGRFVEGMGAVECGCLPDCWRRQPVPSTFRWCSRSAIAALGRR